uniref:hAT-like transposase RNase-H fold domain-containing protein n=1 Tax=Lactuca sativa TaxID=4236 RepID=A0A9R1X816_LACSA|nr:hypothetical protein LSAT_V11C600328210 [Lactuca sativa]
MKEKYDKYWSNSSNINVFLFIAPILDPRYKLGYVSFIISQKKVLRDLYAHYSHEVRVIDENPRTSSENVEEIVIDVDDDPTTFLNNQYKDCWKETQVVHLQNVSWIGIWVSNVSLWTTSSIYLVGGRNINTRGRVLDAFCSLLTPKTVEGLICCQNWFRSKNVPINIDECFEALENYKVGMTLLLYVKDLPQAISILLLISVYFRVVLFGVDFEMMSFSFVVEEIMDVFCVIKLMLNTFNVELFCFG